MDEKLEHNYWFRKNVENHFRTCGRPQVRRAMPTEKSRVFLEILKLETDKEFHTIRNSTMKTNTWYYLYFQDSNMKQIYMKTKHIHFICIFRTLEVHMMSPVFSQIFWTSLNQCSDHLKPLFRCIAVLPRIWTPLSWRVPQSQNVKHTIHSWRNQCWAKLCTRYPHDTLSKNRLLFIIIMYYIQFSCISHKKSISSSEAIVAPIHITKDCLHRNQILIDNE